MSRSALLKPDTHFQNENMVEPSNISERLSLSEGDSDDAMEKDDTELELEKLVFGDDTGFHERLKSHRSEPTALDKSGKVWSKQEQPGDLLENGMEDIDDADVCTFTESTNPNVPD